MLSKRFTVLTLLVLSVVLAATDAFAPPSSTKSLDVRKTASLSTATTTQLAERQWNFNEGRSPWGLKRNAEIWNGRLAQVRVVLFLVLTAMFAHQRDLLINISLYGIMFALFRWHLSLSFCKNS